MLISDFPKKQKTSYVNLQGGHTLRHLVEKVIDLSFTEETKSSSLPFSVVVQKQIRTISISSPFDFNKENPQVWHKIYRSSEPKAPTS